MARNAIGRRRMLGNPADYAQFIPPSSLDREGSEKSRSATPSVRPPPEIYPEEAASRRAARVSQDSRERDRARDNLYANLYAVNNDVRRWLYRHALRAVPD